MARTPERMLPTLKYVEICQELRRRIKAGEYQHGERLPSQPRLAEEFNVALLTLRQALQLLESQGFLHRRSGSGTYAARPEPRRMTALVVDDEESIREVLSALLERMGWSAKTAENGEEALRVLEREKVDLIILDLGLPGMDGSEAFQRVRDVDGDIPVVIITGYADSELMARALQIGPFAIVRKPFRASDIESIVRNLWGTTVFGSAR